MNLPENYIPVLIQAAVGLGFVLLSILGTHFLGPKNSSKKKNENFECGYEIEEIVFFYPYAVNFKEFGVEGFLAILAFVAVFFIGFLYVWKRGALDWDK
ncbi:hypothetical protein Lal_00014645 [Lupinus albus]|nr:hypothetical protein Lal_00014645 [Lupinus albus]